MTPDDSSSGGQVQQSALLGSANTCALSPRPDHTACKSKSIARIALISTASCEHPTPVMHTHLFLSLPYKVAGPRRLHDKPFPFICCTRRARGLRTKSSNNGAGEGNTACRCSLGLHSFGHKTRGSNSTCLQVCRSVQATIHLKLMSNGRIWPFQRICRARLMTSVRTGMKLCR